MKFIRCPHMDEHQAPAIGIDHVIDLETVTRERDASTIILCPICFSLIQVYCINDFAQKVFRTPVRMMKR